MNTELANKIMKLISDEGLTLQEADDLLSKLKEPIAVVKYKPVDEIASKPVSSFLKELEL